MASHEKVRWAQLRTGILATAAMIIAGALITLLSGQGTIFEGNFHVKTYMEDTAGMASNTPVRVNGILAGHIGEVKLSGSRDRKKQVEIDMVLREPFLTQIPDDSKAAVSAANLLGDKYINITRGTHPKHVEPGGQIEALESQDIPEIIAQSAHLLTEFETILGRLDGLLAVVESGKGNIGKLIKDDSLYDRLNATAGEVAQLVSDVKNSNGTISHLLYDDTLYQDIRKPIQRLDEMLADVQRARGSAGKLIYDPQLYDEAKASITEAKKLVENLNAGKGTAGKLLSDDQIYTQLNLIASKVNSAIDKINSGQGTVGQLMVNPQLYDSLNSVSRDASALIRDMRANPKKFLSIRLVLF